MQCPKCNAEAGAGEFCPSCLAQIAAPALKPDEVDAKVAKQDQEEKLKKAQQMKEGGRRMILYAGAFLMAVSIAAAALGIIDQLRSPGSSAEGEPVRLKCRTNADCGLDRCGREIACADSSCRPLASACPSAPANNN